MYGQLMIKNTHDSHAAAATIWL